MLGKSKEITVQVNDTITRLKNKINMSEDIFPNEQCCAIKKKKKKETPKDLKDHRRQPKCMMTELFPLLRKTTS